MIRVFFKSYGGHEDFGRATEFEIADGFVQLMSPDSDLIVALESSEVCRVLHMEKSAEVSMFSNVTCPECGDNFGVDQEEHPYIFQCPGCKRALAWGSAYGRREHVFVCGVDGARNPVAEPIWNAESDEGVACPDCGGRFLLKLAGPPEVCPHCRSSAFFSVRQLEKISNVPSVADLMGVGDGSVYAAVVVLADYDWPAAIKGRAESAGYKDGGLTGLALVQDMAERLVIADYDGAGGEPEPAEDFVLGHSVPDPLVAEPIRHTEPDEGVAADLETPTLKGALVGSQMGLAPDPLVRHPAESITRESAAIDSVDDSAFKKSISEISFGAKAYVPEDAAVEGS